MVNLKAFSESSKEWVLSRAAKTSIFIEPKLKDNEGKFDNATSACETEGRRDTGECLVSGREDAKFDGKLNSCDTSANSFAITRKLIGFRSTVSRFRSIAS